MEDYTYLYNNGHSRERHLVENDIYLLEKAIENIGKDNMQIIRISSHEMGMGFAMESGKYIDLSDSPFIYKGIKDALIKMLEVKQEILEEINNEK